MAENYQSDPRKKNANSDNIFEKPMSTDVEKKTTEEELENIKTWTTFYRKNIHRFIEHYMGIILFPYQRMWVYLMSHSMIFLGWAARASAKSWLVGVFSVAKCILYPGLTVSLSSSTKAQAGLIIAVKIQQIHDDHPNIQREIRNITTNQNKWQVDFHNGSIINVVISGESGRGHRSNICVLEERRLIPSAIIDSIIRPFLVARTPAFLMKYKKKYKNIYPIEEPQEIVISSVHYTSGEWYPETKKRLKRLVNGDDDIKAIFFDYLIAIYHGIKTKKQMVLEKDAMDDITFSMEYGNIPFGGSSTSFFDSGFFTRTLRRPWLPRRAGANGIGKNKYDIPRKDGEIRLMGVDIASRAGKKNDNTIISLARLFPTKKGWRTDVVYLESHHGKNTLLQALRIKQVWEEFSGYHEDDRIILDIANVGIGIFDSLTQVTKDEEMDKEYDALTIIVEDEDFPIRQETLDDLENRTLNPDNAHPCIYPISASGGLNSDIASAFRTRLKSKLVYFLAPENEQEEFYIDKKNPDITKHEDLTLRAYLLSPNSQTTLLVNEAISLEMKMTDGDLVKLKEPEGGRKDRYSSVSYLNYYVSLMDIILLKVEDEQGDLESWLGATMVGNSHV